MVFARHYLLTSIITTWFCFRYQVGLACERFFTPRLHFKTYNELNAWLFDRYIAYAKGSGLLSRRPVRPLV